MDDNENFNVTQSTRVDGGGGSIRLATETFNNNTTYVVEMVDDMMNVCGLRFGKALERSKFFNELAMIANRTNRTTEMEYGTEYRTGD